MATPSKVQPLANPQAPRASVLVVSAHSRDVPTLRTLLGRSGTYVVQYAPNAPLAVNMVNRHGFDVVLWDLANNDGAGMSDLATLVQSGYRGAVVVLGDSGDKETVGAALGAGAYDYVVKDDRLWSVLPGLIVRASRYGRMARRVGELEGAVETLRRQVDDVARDDPLTGLFKASYVSELYERELRRLKRYGGFMSILEATFYNLAGLRESSGPAAADDVLKGFAAILKKTLRSTDFAGYAGEGRFSLLLPSTDTTGAKTLATRLERLVAEANERAPNRPEMKVSFHVRAAGSYEDLTKIRPG